MRIDEPDETEDEVLDTQGDEQSNAQDPKDDVKDPKAVKGESARESIIRALKQSNDEDTEEETEEKDDKSTNIEKAAKPEVKEEKKEVPKTATKSSPPPGWTPKAKAVWATLPPEVQESVAKREQEASDGFKQYGARVKEYEELDNTFKPREQELQKMGVSKAQVVTQMFQWIDAFANPDKNYAKQQLIKLGKNYGIDLEVKVAPQATQTVTDPTKVETQVQTPEFKLDDQPEFKSLKETVAEIARKEEQQRKAAADTFLNNWSKDKPHFQAVRQNMFALLQSGAIALKNGELDLDSAYDQAVYANPTTRELVLKEKVDADAAKAQADKEKKELTNLRKVNKAKTASSSVTARAPTGSSVPNSGKNGKSPSIRESIKESISQLRDA